MLKDTYTIRTRADCPSLARAAGVVEQAAWNSLGFLNFTRAHYDYYDALLEHYASYQLCAVSDATGYVAAAANCVPFYWEGDKLPPEGWDWIVETAYKTRDRKPNMLGGLAVSVPTVHRATGLARLMIKGMRDLAVSRGLRGPVIPVRPSRKSLHPDVGIADYVNWRDDQGRVYDPWMRSHVSMGGSIIGVAERSMVVEEPIGFWETWAGQRFEGEGRIEVPGALVPVEIDRTRGVGRYTEPNVWFSYA